MPRKSGRTLSDNREATNRRYRRGSKITKVLRGDGAIPELELAMLQDYACLLFAAGCSQDYIADAIGVSRGTVNGWFKNDKSMAERVAQIKQEMIGSAVKLMHTYTLEIIEGLMDMARSTDDEGLAAKIWQDLLDRIGISKVNKSESVSAQTIREQKEVDLVDKSGLAEALKDAPPEVQLAIAERMDEVLALASEHTGKDVNE